MLPIIPPLAYYLQVLSPLAKVFLYPSSPYAKSLHLNSFSIPSANGYLRLSIPLKGGRTRTRSLADTEIDYHSSWSRQHKKALDTCYHNSPWYAWYIEDFWNVYAAKHRFLLDKIIAVYQYLGESLEHKQELELIYQQNWPAMISYDNQIPEYPQVFAHKLGFMPKVSLLDLLFHLGPKARDYCTEYIQNK